MADLAMLALSLIAVAAVFVAMRVDDDETGEKTDGEIDGIPLPRGESELDREGRTMLR
ncbi:hypothetical protein A8924_0260 [Saccharopolyspora erythraea NRRL 2338]|uniref:Uncharacterized protein n=2 Tax=Saccharopolyspora erythraea TaxID=1836 RepID=A4FQV8_SACEN|nr:hypothetical protein [Saccharopolyspora erythraea]EQD85758.1 hypothetical protein N599_13290 [Saccharopolyspora erythraea D]PFG93035.1 hypothetical protein A8924_0260 [Saccharopolyspora erythraea NRRL 2338]QRK89917.1 hypothetical protein JQX30_36420 [Saccharopolyspora erythraea]CAM06433.1 hypothetical protein SACE_7275 [Saccharopolyspora erythraea NRRL 2338]